MSSLRLYELSARLGQVLLERGWMLVTAESCTGGWIAEAITAVPGSSQWFDRGFVTYSNEAKQEMLGVSAATLAEQGAVSEAVVSEMATAALNSCHAHMSVATSGIAGPDGGAPGKPVGTVCFAWLVRNDKVRTETHCFEGDRERVREQSVEYALAGLVARICG